MEVKPFDAVKVKEQKELQAMQRLLIKKHGYYKAMIIYYLFTNKNGLGETVKYADDIQEVLSYLTLEDVIKTLKSLSNDGVIDIQTQKNNPYAPNYITIICPETLALLRGVNNLFSI